MGIFSGKDHVAGGYIVKNIHSRTFIHCIIRESLIVARPRFYEILRKHAPEGKINFKKEIINTKGKDGKVHICRSDGTTYSGDILIDADGTHSGARQSLYRQLNEELVLPKSDLEDFSIDYTTIVDVATPSNPEKYPQMKNEFTSSNQIIYNDSSNAN